MCTRICAPGAQGVYGYSLVESVDESVHLVHRGCIFVVCPKAQGVYDYCVIQWIHGSVPLRYRVCVVIVWCRM